LRWHHRALQQRPPRNPLHRNHPSLLATANGRHGYIPVDRSFPPKSRKWEWCIFVSQLFAQSLVYSGEKGRSLYCWSLRSAATLIEFTAVAFECFRQVVIDVAVLHPYPHQYHVSSLWSHFVWRSMMGPYRAVDRSWSMVVAWGRLSSWVYLIEIFVVPFSTGQFALNTFVYLGSV
jgi:hypothetical protein